MALTVKTFVVGQLHLLLVVKSPKATHICLDLPQFPLQFAYFCLVVEHGEVLVGDEDRHYLGGWLAVAPHVAHLAHLAAKGLRDDGGSFLLFLLLLIGVSCFGNLHLFDGCDEISKALEIFRLIFLNGGIDFLLLD